MNVELTDFYLKERVIIVQANGDAGDAPQKTSMAHVAFIALNRPLEADFWLATWSWRRQDNPYVWIRDESFWNDPDDFSRDQQDPFIIALGLYGMRNAVRRTLLLQLKRFGRYQNKDWANPATVSLYIRALDARFLYPLLIVSDLGLLVGSLIMAFDKNPDHVDDDNHLVKLMQAVLRLPTPVSYLARKLYSWTRPLNYGNSAVMMNSEGLQRETSAIMGALAWKHRPSTGASKAMVELWRPIVEKWF